MTVHFPFQNTYAALPASFFARVAPTPVASHVVAETAKCPVVEIAIPVRSTGWSFVNVNVFAALVVPTFCFA